LRVASAGKSEIKTDGLTFPSAAARADAVPLNPMLPNPINGASSGAGTVL
jgi:hypothetical protein